MNYRKEIDKIYRKLESFAQRGDDAIMDFREYIDQIVEYGLYGIFIDVMDLKYFIDVRKYASVELMKKDVFEKIKFQTMSKFNKNLKSLYDSKGVFTNGRKYYDSQTSKFLGEIIEIENYSNNNYVYYDTRLNNRLNQSEDLNLSILVGVSSSLYNAISRYAPDSNRVVTYGTNSQVVYGGFIYDCIKEYTWTYGSPITPTYSEYWTFSNVPTYSVFSVTGSTKTLLDKYEEAIDIIKSVN
jgi:hypothetical protein